jgi:hypothetical protein
MASGTAKVQLQLIGLGEEMNVKEKFDTTTAPTAACHHYRTLAVADTAEALDVGDVAATHMLWIKAVTNDLDVDLDFVSAFDKDLTIQAGEVALIPVPAGTVYVKNNGAGETPVYEYVVLGTT